MNTSDKIVDF